MIVIKMVDINATDIFNYTRSSAKDVPNFRILKCYLKIRPIIISPYTSTSILMYGRGCKRKF